MSVHLNARLNTRFIPILLSAALLLLTYAATALHAEEALPSQDTSEGTGMREVMQQDLRDLLERSDLSRIDRRPGFSNIIYAPQDPLTAGPAAALKKDKEPIAEIGSSSGDFLDYSDQLPTQPSEISDQR